MSSIFERFEVAKALSGSLLVFIDPIRRFTKQWNVCMYIYVNVNRLIEKREENFRLGDKPVQCDEL